MSFIEDSNEIYHWYTGGSVFLLLATCSKCNESDNKSFLDVHITNDDVFLWYSNSM